MNKGQFEKLKTSLLERGYRIYDQHWHHEDYVIGKGFHKADNQWEEEGFDENATLIEPNDSMSIGSSTYLVDKEWLDSFNEEGEE